jgi:hypothetical protein
MTDEKIIHLCQVISCWVSKRGQAMVWQEKKVFDKCDKEVKKRIKELKEVIKNE